MNGLSARGRAAWPVLGAVLAVAAILRLYRLDFDLPEVVWVDAFKFVDQAMRMVRAGSLRPHEFQYPGLYTGLLAAAYGLFDVQTSYTAHLIGRMVAAASGIGLVWAVWFAASKIAGFQARVMAASLAAFSVVSLTYSRVCSTDALYVLFMTSALALLAGRPEKPALFAAAGALTGLAAGTKYTGAFVLPFMVLAALAAAYHRRNRGVLYGGLAAGSAAGAACFLLTTPWFIPLLQEYFRRFALECALQSSGVVGKTQMGYLDYLFSGSPEWESPWLGMSLLSNLGPLVLIAGTAAAAAALSGRHGFGPFFYALVLTAYLAVFSRPGHVKSARYLLPVLPLLFVLTGWAVERLLLERLRRGRAAVFACALAALLAVPAVKSARYVSRLRRPSTNAEARGWAAENIPAGSKVFMSPFYTHNLHALPLSFVYPGQIGHRIHGLSSAVGSSPEREPIYHPGLVDGIEAKGARYLVLNSYFDGAFSPVPENLRHFPRSTAAYQAFMGRVRSRAELLYSVRGQAQGRFGPDIEIYRLKDGPRRSG